jgi:hypothetical protein
MGDKTVRAAIATAVHGPSRRQAHTVRTVIAPSAGTRLHSRSTRSVIPNTVEVAHVTRLNRTWLLGM